ncbi:LysR family transcriptional regulator [Agarivorans sp. DSG3-1]
MNRDLPSMSVMNKNSYQQLDLNLLKTFLVLFDEQNMRKASERLFVSQPAISQALSKLRNHFGDELFVKVHGGLKATAFSEELIQLIQPHMSGLENALNRNNELDLSTLDQTINIALSPVVMTCLSGALYRAVSKQAPNSRLVLTSWSSSTLEDIQKGRILAGVNYDVSHPKEVYSQHMIELEGRVIVRQDHPLKKSLATLKDISEYEIASLFIPGWNDDFSLAAEAMKREGLPAKIGFRSEVVMALIDVVLHTNMFMPHSNLFPQHLYPSLRTINVLINGETFKEPVLSYSHVKNRNSPMMTWLQGLIKNALEAQVSLNTRKNNF